MVKEVFHSLCCEGKDLPNAAMDLEQEQRQYSYNLREEEKSKEERLQEVMANVTVRGKDGTPTLVRRRKGGGIVQGT
jgi:hypothetical protein